MSVGKIILSITLVAGLSACGDTFGEQALIGAGTGAVATAVAGGNVGAGALVGAAANVTYCQRFPGRCN
ncbi:MAG: hypothetical protein ACRBBU_02445 [Pseudooceanicola sp.]